MKKLHKLKLKERPKSKNINFWTSVEVDTAIRVLNIYSTSPNTPNSVLEYVIELDDYIMFDTLFIKNQQVLNFMAQSANFGNSGIVEVETFLKNAITSSGIKLDYYSPEDVAFKVIIPLSYIVLAPKNQLLAMSPFIFLEDSTNIKYEVIGMYDTFKTSPFSFSENLLNLFKLFNLIPTLYNVKPFAADMVRFEKIFKSQIAHKSLKPSNFSVSYRSSIDEVKREFTLIKEYNNEHVEETQVVSFPIDAFLSGKILFKNTESTNIYIALATNSDKLKSPHTLLFKLFEASNLIIDDEQEAIIQQAKQATGYVNVPHMNKNSVKLPQDEEAEIVLTFSEKKESNVNSILAFKSVSTNINIYKVETPAVINNTYIEIGHLTNTTLHTKVAKTLFSNSPKVELLYRVTSSSTKDDITNALMSELDNICNEDLTNLVELQKYAGLLLTLQKLNESNIFLAKNIKLPGQVYNPSRHIEYVNSQFNVLLIT